MAGGRVYPARGRKTAVTRDPVWITRSLLAVLLELADDAEPRSANVLLVASPAGDLVPIEAEAVAPEAQPVDEPARRPDGPQPVPLADLDPATPVYSDFYFPDVGNAVRNVFGVDLGTPAGQTHGRFLSHPDGDPEMSITDDLHAMVLVAIPPWEPRNVTAYSRQSRRKDLRVVAAGTEDAAFDG